MLVVVVLGIVKNSLSVTRHPSKNPLTITINYLFFSGFWTTPKVSSTKAKILRPEKLSGKEPKILKKLREKCQKRAMELGELKNAIEGKNSGCLGNCRAPLRLILMHYHSITYGFSQWFARAFNFRWKVESLMRENCG